MYTIFARIYYVNWCSDFVIPWPQPFFGTKKKSSASNFEGLESSSPATVEYSSCPKASATIAAQRSRKRLAQLCVTIIVGCNCFSVILRSVTQLLMEEIRLTSWQVVYGGFDTSQVVRRISSNQQYHPGCIGGEKVTLILIDFYKMGGDELLFACHGTMVVGVAFGFSGHNGRTQNATLEHCTTRHWKQNTASWWFQSIFDPINL